jgi:hypothetical protein
MTMTNLDPDQPRDDDHGLGWITLTDGVTMHSAWLTTRVPDLFTAWQQAQTAQQRMQTARMIQDAAADATAPPDQYDHVRIQWAETRRYEADIYLSPYATDAEIWAGITTLTDAQKRTLDLTDDDGNILSVIDLDLDGDGRPSVLERAISAGNVVSWIAPRDWTDLAATIDERLTQSPDWPALSSALDRAAASGYDVENKLPQLAARDDLPERHPARDLQYRLLADCDAAVPDTDTGSGAADGRSAGRPPDPNVSGSAARDVPGPTGPRY